MEVRVFNIRLNNKHLITDQNRVNEFMEQVQVKKSSTQFIDGKEKMWSMLVYYESGGIDKRPTKSRTNELNLNAEEKKIAERIKLWLTAKAQDQGISPYMVLTNRSVQALVKAKPETEEQLLGVHGIGEIKAELYGQEILNLLNAK